MLVARTGTAEQLRDRGSGVVGLADRGTRQSGEEVDYDAGTKSYVTGSGSGGSGAGDPTQVRINEFLMAPTSPNNARVELYNPAPRRWT